MTPVLFFSQFFFSIKIGIEGQLRKSKMQDLFYFCSLLYMMSLKFFA